MPFSFELITRQLDYNFKKSNSMNFRQTFKIIRNFELLIETKNAIEDKCFLKSANHTVFISMKLYEMEKLEKLDAFL